MSLLAPLYIAGALAIALPILFHLIRRTPTGRQEFSSLMFLSASPPRITRRSRLQNILLLVLRATALIILALAFARPFMRSSSNAAVTEARGRRVAILVDTSASMSRGDLAAQARRQADDAIGELSPTDEVALYAFDRGTRPVFSFEQWNTLDAGQRMAALRGSLSAVSPTDDATQIGDAVASAADVLAGGEDKESGATERRIVLISDMQRGGRVETLQRYEWPKNVTLQVRPVALKETTNASLQLVKEAEADGSASPAAPGPSGGGGGASAAGSGATAGGADAPLSNANRVRVRVSNESGGSREQFTLAWANAKGPTAGAPVQTYVPPGRSQVVRLPLPDPDADADRVVLSGDDFSFDNTLFIVPPRKETIRVVYLGADGPDDVKGMQYYARHAMGDTPRRTVEFVARQPADGLADADVADARLIIATAGIPEARLAAVRKFVEAGGDLLWVLRDASESASLAMLMQQDAPEVGESADRDFALIARVEFDHPLLAPFAEARFADFSRIHFWKHRRVSVDEGPGVRVLMRFDRGPGGDGGGSSGDPFLIEQTLGRGRLFVMTSGWHPADSQLALSTKFVPLLEGFLKRRDAVGVEAQYAVHEPIALPAGASLPSGGVSPARTIVGPDGRKVELLHDVTTFTDAARPGIYRLLSGGAETPLAVNLAAEESRTAPLAAEELEQYGVRLGGVKETVELTERRRQLEKTELENRQKLWRWLVVGVIGLLAAETLLAGRLARRERGGRDGDRNPEGRQASDVQQETTT